MCTGCRKTVIRRFWKAETARAALATRTNIKVYNKSEEHYRNLVKARIAATKKEICKFCSKEYTLGNISKHESSCVDNPENYRFCVNCNARIKSKRHEGSVCCSRACANSYFRSDVNHPNYKPESFNNYRVKAFSVHKKACIICGEDKIVAIHHMDEDHNNVSPDNLVPLCPTHHHYWHSKYRSIIEESVLKFVDKVKAGIG